MAKKNNQRRVASENYQELNRVVKRCWRRDKRVYVYVESEVKRVEEA